MNIDVFVSYHTESSLHIVENIVNRLEANAIRCWYAKRDCADGYAGRIADVIYECRVFLLVLNKDASESQHVINELNLITERLSNKEEVSVMPFHIADEEISRRTKYYIGAIHWIDAKTPPMDQRIEELVERILSALGRERVINHIQTSSAEGYKLKSKLPLPRDIFYGRDMLLDKIAESFEQGKRVLFLEGIGGIGKSELAKQYAVLHKKEYEHIVFLTYNDSLETLVCDPMGIEIEGLEQGEEPAAEFFQRKMKVIRSLCDERTLFIVDNFDVDEDESLSSFLEGNHRVIFTSRNSHRGHITLKVEAIEDKKVLFRIFEENYGMDIYEEDYEVLDKLFDFVECHTYMIELVAKQMEASCVSAGEMYDMIAAGTVLGELTETVEGRSNQKTAFDHMCSVFNLSNLSDQDKYILMLLSVVGTGGIPAKRFQKWAELTGMNAVNGLIKKSWVRKERNQKLSLHPLVAEVVRELLKPTLEKCDIFVGNMAMFAYRAWHRPYGENLEVADNVYSVLNYFSPLDASVAHYYESMVGYLWQVARFEDSIYFGHKLFEACMETYGEASMTTGYIAKALAGCYFNSGREKESIPWYKQGLRCMELYSMEDDEDLAMSYEKVARCYTWEYEQDFQKAEEYFDKSLQMRLRLKEAILAGEKKTWYMPFEEYDLKMACERIGEAYMEMGRMYLFAGDYEKALEYAQKFEENLREYPNRSESSYAYAYYDQGKALYHIAREKKRAGLAYKEDLKRAEEQLKRALEINMRMRGGIANDTIYTQECLGDVYAAMERYGDASNAYMAVVNMLEKLFGESCERIATVKEKMMFKA